MHNKTSSGLTVINASDVNTASVEGISNSEIQLDQTPNTINLVATSVLVNGAPIGGGGASSIPQGGPLTLALDCDSKNLNNVSTLNVSAISLHGGGIGIDLKSDTVVDSGAIFSADTIEGTTGTGISIDLSTNDEITLDATDVITTGKLATGYSSDSLPALTTDGLRCNNWGTFGQTSGGSVLASNILSVYSDASISDNQSIFHVQKGLTNVLNIYPNGTLSCTGSLLTDTLESKTHASLNIDLSGAGIIDFNCTTLKQNGGAMPGGWVGTAGSNLNMDSYFLSNVPSISALSGAGMVIKNDDMTIQISTLNNAIRFNHTSGVKLSVYDTNIVSTVPLQVPSSKNSGLSAGHLCSRGDATVYTGLEGRIVKSNGVYSVFDNQSPFNEITLPKDGGPAENMTKIVLTTQNEDKAVMGIVAARYVSDADLQVVVPAVGVNVTKNIGGKPAGYVQIGVLTTGEGHVTLLGGSDPLYRYDLAGPFTQNSPVSANITFTEGPYTYIGDVYDWQVHVPGSGAIYGANNGATGDKINLQIGVTTYPMTFDFVNNTLDFDGLPLTHWAATNELISQDIITPGDIITTTELKPIEYNYIGGNSWTYGTDSLTFHNTLTLGHNYRVTWSTFTEYMDVNLDGISGTSTGILPGTWVYDIILKKITFASLATMTSVAGATYSATYGGYGRKAVSDVVKSSSLCKTLMSVDFTQSAATLALTFSGVEEFVLARPSGNRTFKTVKMPVTML